MIGHFVCLVGAFGPTSFLQTGWVSPIGLYVGKMLWARWCAGCSLVDKACAGSVPIGLSTKASKWKTVAAYRGRQDDATRYLALVFVQLELYIYFVIYSFSNLLNKLYLSLLILAW
jgi:hypothetical protein